MDRVPKMSDHIYVTTRSGKREPVSFDKVLKRIQGLADGLDHVNPDLVALKVCSQIADGIKTSELDEFAAETCAMMQARHHPNYGKLAARIVIDNHQKLTPPTLRDCVDRLGKDVLVSHNYVWDLSENHEELEAMIDYSRDFNFDYFGFKTLEKGYLLRTRDGKACERPQHMWMRVALQLHGTTDTNKPDFARIKETYDALSLGYFIQATPTLFNSGTPHPQLSSCFLLTMDSDSIQGIYKTLGDCAQISKWAGGIGLAVHDIRAKDSHINGTNGKSTGIVPMLKVFNDTAKYVNQGGKRNGSFAIYVEPWHADVEDFLRLKLNTGAEEDRARDLFYGLWIPDLFMQRVESDGPWSLMCPHECPGLADCWGDNFVKLYESYEAAGKFRRQMPAKKLWQLILDAQIQTGTPYLCYKDAANSKSNQQNLGTIRSSNLCVAPETLVLTDEGQFPIHQLQNKHVNVWNGTEFSMVEVLKTGINQELVDVELSDGHVITCTPYHKFLVSRSYQDKGSFKNALRIDAQHLKHGMKLRKFELTLTPGDSKYDIKYPYTHGFFCGDGTYSNGKPILALYGEKKALVPYLDIRTCSGVEDAGGRLNNTLPLDLEQKFKVPINAGIVCRVQWLAGLLDADGSIARNGTNESIQLASIHYQFLKDVQSLLTGLGVHSKIVKMFGDRKTMLPDGHGGHKEFDCKPLWRLLISSSGLYNLNELHFETHRLKWSPHQPQRNAEQFVQVVAVHNTGRVDDTYCFNEPINHAGVFNGVLTGNCTEIMEFTSPGETAVCNLGSLALPKYVENGKFNFEKLRKYTRILIHNLDKVIDKNFYPTPETKASNMKHRPVGLGVQGLADVFAMMRIPWSSKEAEDLNREIFENIYYAAVYESQEIAYDTPGAAYHYQSIGTYSSFKGSPASKEQLQFDLWGQQPTHTPYLDWKELKGRLSICGLRNSLLIAPMPTASTSQILGNNECIEPFTSNLYTRRVLAGEFVVVNKYLVEDLTQIGLWNSDVRSQIIANNGSVQGIAEIPAEIRELYKTSWEIPMKTVINLAASRAPFICQSQSLNLFVAEPTYSKISSMHFYAWKKGLKTGCYYLRTKAAAKAQQFTVEPPACLTCTA
jgi:ribonucleoside-diphosphate reductase alpha chain